MMLLESGLKAADSFPAGLKVLVVDDDPTWLKILEKMLKKCSYQVTTCGLAIEALRLLRERKDGFDIVISDVNMPDMDGFKLLEHVGLQMDLPVIMMSVDGETSRVMRGVQHGACDYLLKPIRMKELKNIWQHVLRKRMRDVRDIESHDNLDDDDLHLFRYDLSDGGHFLASSDQTFLRKRKDMDSKKGVKDSTDPSAKRRRVVWSVELHQKFVKAVNQIGFDKVGPKKILDLMNVPLLTRENVASHLQKYRLYLSRLEKENDLKSQFPNDSVGGFGTQNSTMQQSELVNFPCPDYEPREQSIDAKPYKISPSGINSWPLVEPGSVFTSDIAQVHEAAFSPKVGHDISTGLRESKFSLAALDSSLPSQLNVSRESLNSLSELEYKPHQQLLETSSVKELNLLSAETCNNITEQPHLIGQLTESFGLTTNSLIHIDRNGLPGFEFEPRNHTSSSESAFGSLPGELGDLFSFRYENFATESMGFENIDYSFPDLSNEALSFCLYGQPRFNYEYFNDSVEYAVVDQSLFIS